MCGRAWAPRASVPSRVWTSCCRHRAAWASSTGFARRAPAAREVTALDAYLVTASDHGMNASTFTARVVASTQADLFAAVTAGYCALTGPLHGGAPEPVLEMLDAIGTRERIKPWVDAALAGGERMVGFGQRVYRVRDPRADVLKAAIERLAGEGADLPFAGEVESYIRAALPAGPHTRWSSAARDG